MWRETILERGWWEPCNSVPFYSTAWRGNWVRKHDRQRGHEGFVWGTHVTDFMVRDLGKNASPLPREEKKLLQCSAQESEGRWKARRWVSYQKASMCSRWGLFSCLGFSHFKWRLIHISKTEFEGKGLVEMIPKGSQGVAAGLGKALGWKWQAVISFAGEEPGPHLVPGAVCTRASDTNKAPSSPSRPTWGADSLQCRVPLGPEVWKLRRGVARCVSLPSTSCLRSRQQDSPSL